MSNRTTDPLTIAYVAIGAIRALDLREGLTDEQSDRFEGELGFIDQVISSNLSRLDELVEEAGDSYSGTFCYEIAETYGEIVGKALLDNQPIDTEALAKQLVGSGVIPAEAMRP